MAIRLPEDETRSVAGLVAAPEALASYFPSVATVLIEPPEEGSIAVEGAGVLEEQARHAIICATPTGADPEEYMAAMSPGVPGRSRRTRDGTTRGIDGLPMGLDCPGR